MTKLYIRKNERGIFYYKDERGSIRHREDGPAIEYKNGTKVWWFNGKYHRLDGPAIEYYDGHKEWWLNDKKCSEEEHKRLIKMINFL